MLSDDSRHRRHIISIAVEVVIETTKPKVELQVFVCSRRYETDAKSYLFAEPRFMEV